MRVALLTASVSGKGSGLAEAVQGLAAALRDEGAEIWVFALKDAGASESMERRGANTSIFGTRGPTVFGYAPGLAKALTSSQADVLHLHGLWKYTSVACRGWFCKTGKPYIVSPHGMLDAYALRQSAWKKRLAWILYEGSNLKRAACLHALSGAEAASLRRIGLNNPIAVIPNGVEFPTCGRPEAPDWAQALKEQEKVLLYLGRLHPKKGLKELVMAWSRVDREAAGSGWRLVICGWGDNGYEREIRQMACQLRVSDRVLFPGPRFGPAKDATYARASAFVLPSRSEGMPIAVLEAWCRGLPVLMTPECNLPEGFAAGAAIRLDADPDSIAEGLRKLFGMPEAERHRVGELGRRLAAERFSWKGASAQMKRVYEWVSGKGPAPAEILV